jgi:hypothetical protein
VVEARTIHIGNGIEGVDKITPNNGPERSIEATSETIRTGGFIQREVLDHLPDFSLSEGLVVVLKL